MSDEETIRARVMVALNPSEVSNIGTMRLLMSRPHRAVTTSRRAAHQATPPPMTARPSTQAR